MKLNEKFPIFSEKVQRRMDRVTIFLGLSLLIASFCSYYVLEAYGQEDLFQLDCPKDAYHGLDGQGNEACRNILTNNILESGSLIITYSDSEKITESEPEIITEQETRKIILDDEQTPIVEIIILALIGILGSIIGIIAKKRKLEIFQRRGWSGIQKEQVRNRQYGKCNICFTPPSKWKYDHINGNKSNNDLNNCQGLCTDCHSVKIERNNRLSIYQKAN